MFLALTTIAQHGESQHFFCQFDKLEEGFGFLNEMVFRKNRLLKAAIHAKDQVTPLPIEAFDGVPFTAVMKRLETEWSAILRSVHLRRLWLISRRHGSGYNAC